MSRIDQLISQYCPAGVPMVRLGELGTFENIGVDKKKIPGEPIVKLLNYVDIYHNKKLYASLPSMIVSSPEKKIEACNVIKGDIFVTPSSETIDDIGHSAVAEEDMPGVVYSYHIMRYRFDSLNMTTSHYVNYLFDTESVKSQIIKLAQGLTRFGLSKGKFAQISIPLPPLPVQEEIVRILDAMSNLVTNLDAEISARQKQYEHAREKLLTFGEEVERKSLIEVCKSIRTGKLNANAQVADGEFPFFTCDAFPYRIDTFAFDTEAILVSGNGSQVGHINYYKGKFNAYQRTYVLSNFVENVDVIYLLHLFKAYMKGYILENSKKGSVPYITLPMLEAFSIPLPPLSVQQSIVERLDKMESLIQNLQAERNLRQKQYEYYREKLLTF